MTATPTLRPIEGTFAAEALDVDLALPLEAGTLAWIDHAFADHPVLVFREQDLGPGELTTFGRCFGKSKPHSLVDYRHHEYPEVSWLTNVDKDGRLDLFGVKRATDWHTDSPYEDEPPRLMILHAKEVPSSKARDDVRGHSAAYDALGRNEAAARRHEGCTAAAMAPPASGSTRATPISGSTGLSRKARPAAATSRDRADHPLRESAPHARLPGNAARRGVDAD
jgi:taurine dioxygenase